LGAVPPNRLKLGLSAFFSSVLDVAGFSLVSFFSFSSPAKILVPEVFSFPAVPPLRSGVSKFSSTSFEFSNFLSPEAPGSVGLDKQPKGPFGVVVPNILVFVADAVVPAEPKSPVPLFGALANRFGLGTFGSDVAIFIVSSRSSSDWLSVSLMCPDSPSDVAFSSDEETTTFLLTNY
jgi:hypothetical protein